MKAIILARVSTEEQNKKSEKLILKLNTSEI